GTRHRRGEAASTLVLVHVARLLLDDVQLRPGEVGRAKGGLAPEDRALAEGDGAGRIAHVLRQHHSLGESLAPRDPPRLHASRWRSSARRLSRLWAEANTERCGSAACIPCVSGSYPGLPRSGFSQMSRLERMRRASSARASSAGSPVSQPSLSTITTVRRSTSLPHSDSKVERQAPMRVPPDQSCTESRSPRKALA